MDIPKSFIMLANEPIESKWWKDSEGNEIKRFSDAQWSVTNEKIGSRRLRTIYKMIQEIVIDI